MIFFLHREDLYGLSLSWLCMCLLCGSWRLFLCHTDHSDMDSHKYKSACVSEDNFLVTQSTGIWIVLSMTCHMSLSIVPVYGSFHTQRTLMLILPIVIFPVSYWVVLGMDSPKQDSLRGFWDLSLATENTVIWILHNDSSCASLFGSWRWILCHTEHNDMDSNSLRWIFSHTEYSA